MHNATASTVRMFFHTFYWIMVSRFVNFAGKMPFTPEDFSLEYCLIDHSWVARVIVLFLKSWPSICKNIARHIHFQKGNSFLRWIRPRSWKSLHNWWRYGCSKRCIPFWGDFELHTLLFIYIYIFDGDFFSPEKFIFRYNMIIYHSKW